MVTSNTHRELSLPASLLLASLGTDCRLKLWVWGGWVRGADRSLTGPQGPSPTRLASWLLPWVPKW